MRYHLLRTFLWAGSIYLTVTAIIVGVLMDKGFGLNMFFAEYCKYCPFVITIPIVGLLVPQVLVFFWLSNGRNIWGAGYFALMLGPIFWGLIFSRREYLKLRKQLFNPTTKNEFLITQVSRSTKSKLFYSFWIGFLSVRVVFFLRIFIRLITGIKIDNNIEIFDTTDCSWTSTIDNILSPTPVHCTARKYFSKYVDPLDSFRSDLASYKDPSRLEAYFGSYNATTFIAIL
jgi:hypothetical protein